MSELISPGLRARITRQVIRAPEHCWSGRRRGVSLTFRLADQPNLEHHPFEWAACYRRRRFAGTSATIFDAVLDLTASLERTKGKTTSHGTYRRNSGSADRGAAGRAQSAAHNLPNVRPDAQARLPGL